MYIYIIYTYTIKIYKSLCVIESSCFHTHSLKSTYICAYACIQIYIYIYIYIHIYIYIYV